MSPNFWRNKRVFITGHTGFKGSWASLWLQNLGADLTGFSLEPPTNPSLFEEANVASQMKSIIGDIRNYSDLKNAINLAKPEIVIHMAAQPLVRRSYKDPIETYSTNVMGTVHLLEAIRSSDGIKAVVNVTTDKCYENREWVWGYREDEPMGGFDPYSNSKGCAELVSSAYRSSFFSNQKNGVALATARAGNVIGGGDWAIDRLIPDILSSFNAGKKVCIRNPNAIRPWQHVLEPLCGYFTLAEALFNDGEKFAQAWNFGPLDDDAKPVNWIVEKMANLWGKNASWIIDASGQPHEATYLKLDISKALSQLNWRPRLRLEHSLSLILEWEKGRIAGLNARDLTLANIMQYQNLLID